MPRRFQQVIPAQHSSYGPLLNATSNVVSHTFRWDRGQLEHAVGRDAASLVAAGGFTELRTQQRDAKALGGRLHAELTWLRQNAAAVLGQPLQLSWHYVVRRYQERLFLQILSSQQRTVQNTVALLRFSDTLSPAPEVAAAQEVAQARDDAAQARAAAVAAWTALQATFPAVLDSADASRRAQARTQAQGVLATHGAALQATERRLLQTWIAALAGEKELLLAQLKDMESSIATSSNVGFLAGVLSRAAKVGGRLSSAAEVREVNRIRNAAVSRMQALRRQQEDADADDATYDIRLSDLLQGLPQAQLDLLVATLGSAAIRTRFIEDATSNWEAFRDAELTGQDPNQPIPAVRRQQLRTTLRARFMGTQRPNHMGGQVQATLEASYTVDPRAEARWKTLVFQEVDTRAHRLAEEELDRWLVQFDRTLQQNLAQAAQQANIGGLRDLGAAQLRQAQHARDLAAVFAAAGAGGATQAYVSFLADLARDLDGAFQGHGSIRVSLARDEPIRFRLQGGGAGQGAAEAVIARLEDLGDYRFSMDPEETRRIVDDLLAGRTVELPTSGGVDPFAFLINAPW